MEEQEYYVREFTEYPGPRYIKQGECSGEEFYEKVLKELFSRVVKDNQTLLLVLDGTAGYASSFLDEAIGNITYDHGIDVVKDHLKIISEDEPDWQGIIWDQVVEDWNTKKIRGIPRKSPK